MKDGLKRSTIWFFILSVILLLIGLWIRVYDLDDAPLDFHPTRQLHSALMARGMYVQLGGGSELTEWQQERAIEQWKLEGLIEPPIIEWLSAYGYKLVNAVDLRIPRLIAAAFWLLAAIPLLFLIRESFDQKTALISGAFFLFAPYAVIASRSFQPETLLVLFLSLTLWSIVSWDKKRNWTWAVLAGLFGGLAIWIKTVAVFLIAGMWMGWLLSKKNWKALKDFKLWVAFLLTVLPYGLYLIYGLFVDKGLAGQFSLRFFPSMWGDVAFYLRWLSNVRRVMSIEWIILGLLGLMVAKKKTFRNIGLGAWIGYLLLGFVLPHHISTHDYYHLPLILLVGYGMAGFSDLMIGVIQKKKIWIQVLSIFFIVIFFGILINDARSTLKKEDYRSEVVFWEELGGSFSPDDRVVAISEDYGNRLAYWGWLTPRNWPTLGDIALRQEAGHDLTLQDYFENYTDGYEYFLVTDFEEYEKQPELQNWLEDNYVLLMSTEEYQVFSLSEGEQVQ